MGEDFEPDKPIVGYSKNDITDERLEEIRNEHYNRKKAS